MRTTLVTFQGDLRKLSGPFRATLSLTERSLRAKFKARAWDEVNAEKRRKSSRESKKRLRALRGREAYAPRSFEALQNKLRRDREYQYTRRLLGLSKPSSDAPKFFSLDALRGEDGGDLYNIISSEAMSPLEILIQQEDANE